MGQHAKPVRATLTTLVMLVAMAGAAGAEDKMRLLFQGERVHERRLRLLFALEAPQGALRKLYGAIAIAEISIFASRGKRATSTAARAGGAFLKYVA